MKHFRFQCITFFFGGSNQIPSTAKTASLDFSQLSKQVMLLWKSMIGIFGRDQPQIVCTKLLGQLLAYSCFIPVSGANPAVSRAESSAAALSSAICLRVLYQVTDSVLCSSKAQFKLYTSQGKKKTKTKAQTCTKSHPPNPKLPQSPRAIQSKGKGEKEHVQDNRCPQVIRDSYVYPDRKNQHKFIIFKSTKQLFKNLINKNQTKVCPNSCQSSQNTELAIHCSTRRTKVTYICRETQIMRIVSSYLAFTMLRNYVCLHEMVISKIFCSPLRSTQYIWNQRQIKALGLLHTQLTQHYSARASHFYSSFPDSISITETLFNANISMLLLKPLFSQALSYCRINPELREKRKTTHTLLVWRDATCGKVMPRKAQTRRRNLPIYLSHTSCTP